MQDNDSSELVVDRRGFFIVIHVIILFVMNRVMQFCAREIKQITKLSKSDNKECDQ